MESSFLELKNKQVINNVDGKCLGHVPDIVFDVVTACVLGIVVPEPNQGFWSLFRGNKNLFIPYDCVCKIGVDAILVELYIEDKKPPKCKPKDKNNYCKEISYTSYNDNRR